ncbi:MAG: hypothetical protein M3167_14635 [Acidobacteriota bacterium]|nr:hypothetical protein [Acidobacteriota bacterium]
MSVVSGTSRRVSRIWMFRIGIASAAAFWILTASVSGAVPCCGIASVDRATGVVTARVNATGQVFDFKVGNPTLLAGLQVGAPVDADFAAKVASFPKSPYRFAIGKMPSAPAGKPVLAPAGGASSTPAHAPADPVAAQRIGDYRLLRQRAQSLLGPLHAADSLQAGNARAQWGAFLRDLRAWADRYHVRLVARSVAAATIHRSGASPTPVHLPQLDCPDISGAGGGPGGSDSPDPDPGGLDTNPSFGGADNSGSCFLDSKAAGGTCSYICVPREVIASPNIESSNYPARN